jgi:uncharacterized protein (DUF1015 family)
LADVRPFAGVTYDPARVETSQVLCAPYDVIAPAQQQAYMAREPHNAVRIVLNPAPGEARYSEAAAALRLWLGEGVLRLAPRPALYVHRHSFDAPGAGRLSRTGLIAAVRLEPWSTGAIRPHEHTMPGPKRDRLELMRATGADTEPIWVFHPDPTGEVRRRLDAVTQREPIIDTQFVPEADSEAVPAAERHQLWAVDDPESRGLAAAAGALPLYIADGHHRYETALYHAEESGGPDDAPTRFKVMLLSAAEDPGLLVLPTHRMVRADEQALHSAMTALAARGWSNDDIADLDAMAARLAAPASAGTFGFGVYAGGRFGYLEGPVAATEIAELPPSIAALDVGLLHETVLRPLLGIGPAELAAGDRIAYARDPAEVEARVRAGDFNLGIFIRPPTLAQIQAVADAGENMPQKSTYFWPKPASGLIMALQQPAAGRDSGA